MSETQRSLKFWQARLAAGSHSSFMLLSRGPQGFVTDVLSALGLRHSSESNITAIDRIEERVGIDGHGNCTPVVPEDLRRVLLPTWNNSWSCKMPSVVQARCCSHACSAGPPTIKLLLLLLLLTCHLAEFYFSHIWLPRWCGVPHRDDVMV
jgi:hypothetical protein